MKTKCIFLMTLCAFVCMLGYSRTNIPLSTEIPIGGGGARTPVPSPTAYLDGDEVQVLLSVAAPLTITISGQAGNCLFSKEYASTQEAIIPLSENGITEGDYVLRVFYQNEWWRGDFTVEASRPALTAGATIVEVDSVFYLLENGKATIVDPYPYNRLVNRDINHPDTLVIPSQVIFEGESYTVIGIGVAGLGWVNSVSITLPNTIEFMEAGSFDACTRLEQVNIPEKVTVIEKATFDFCVALKSLDLPEGITAIRNHAFWYCSSLAAISLPTSLKDIGYAAFFHCTSLPSIVIPDGVTHIAEGAFLNCSSLSSISLPESLEAIGVRAFQDIADGAQIYCYAKEPAQIYENTFDFNGTLHVSQGCKEKYQKAAHWKEFANIVDDLAGEASSDETGILASANDNADAAGRYLDLQGRPVDGTQKGIFILNGKKVLVK